MCIGGIPVYHSIVACWSDRVTRCGDHGRRVPCKIDFRECGSVVTPGLVSRCLTPKGRRYCFNAIGDAFCYLAATALLCLVFSRTT